MKRKTWSSCSNGNAHWHTTGADGGWIEEEVAWHREGRNSSSESSTSQKQSPFVVVTVAAAAAAIAVDAAAIVVNVAVVFLDAVAVVAARAVDYDVGVKESLLIMMGGNVEEATQALNEYLLPFALKQ
ncbi:hypothetical protein ElyMa_003607200 [Elysia marginata]|uniref:Uncharacterized protein n=1 Tax=Elysia marginata TaxID=1093978 RepID=A0AAV4ERB1_9GAST|nr:hypothetical protein ElyMa_003607200 [Elysia marginata]